VTVAARWSATSVATTTGLTPRTLVCRLLGDAAETDQRDLRRIDHAVDALGALVAEVRHGERGVAEFGAAQHARPRARDEFGELAHHCAHVLGVRVAQRGRDEPALTQRDADTEVNARGRPQHAVHEEAVHFGRLARGERDGAEQQRGGQQPVGHRATRILRREPIERARQVDACREVVVRDLA
jgi:hypothetical protein